MSDTPSYGPVKYIMPKWIRGPQDFVGGLAMVAIAVFALWASSDLQGMRGFSFGAGTAPRMFAYLLLGLGIAITIVGLIADGEHITTYAWRGPLFVSVAILSFAVTIRPIRTGDWVYRVRAWEPGVDAVVAEALRGNDPPGEGQVYARLRMRGVYAGEAGWIPCSRINLVSLAGKSIGEVSRAAGPDATR